MKDLALGIWDDLREKRLWPLAAALLIAVIAVPVFVIKPAAEPASTGAVAQPRQGQSKPAVGVIDDASRASSGLGIFGKKDPFRPPAAALAPSTTEGAASSVAGAAGPPSTSGGSGGGPPSVPAPGATASPGASGGGAAPRQLSPRRIAYTYVADVTFARNDRSRRYRRLDRLDMLPSQRSPLLIFLGVTSDGDRAVFLVDSTLEADGEGRCSPKASDCATLSIGAGSEHGFTDPEGNAYSLRINEIRRVRVARASSSSRRRARARTAAGRRRRFVAPVLADLITVASPDTDRSGRAARGR